MTGRNMHFAHTWANIKNIKPVIIQKHRKKYQVLEISSFVLKLCQLCLYYHLPARFSPLLKTHNPLMLSLETRSNALCCFSRLEHQKQFHVILYTPLFRAHRIKGLKERSQTKKKKVERARQQF